MTAHGSDNMASRFPESLSEAQTSEINENAVLINKKKATIFGLGVFQGKVLFYTSFYLSISQKKQES